MSAYHLTAVGIISLILPAFASASAIDLHVHLRMDASIPVLHRLTKRAHGQVSVQDFRDNDVRLVAAALYTPFGGTKELLKQISAVEEWAKANGAVIVRTPEEAAEVVKAKDWRLGLILAAEGGHGVDTPESLDLLWERGLRMVTVTHFGDNAWGGAAKVRYFPGSSCRPGGKPDERRNAKGLSPRGEQLVDLAVEKGLILDLTHASDKLVLDVAERHPSLPLVFTHQAARELTPCERAIPPELLREVKRSKGMVGVTFAERYVGADIAAHARVLAREAGPEALALGSDYNGMIEPVGGYADVLKLVPEARGSAERFVALWRRTNAARSKTRRP